MPNIQVIDGADNCTYDVFFASPESFKEIFPVEGGLENAFVKRWTRNDA